MPDRLVMGAIYADEDDIDEDLAGFLPPGVELRTEHYPSYPPDDDEIRWVRRMAAHPGIQEAAKRLAAHGAGAIVYSINSFSAIDGPVGAAAISDRIRVAADGVPAVTTSGAMVEAVRALGVRRLAVSVPYGPVVSGAVRECFESGGVDVVALCGLDLPNANNWEALLLSDEAVIDMVRAADSAQAEAIYVGCTSLRTAHLMERAEEAVGKPVVTANGATIWQGLRLMGHAGRRADRGSLFHL
jgi:maleate isomerase